MLWLWCRLAAVAPIRPLILEPPYAKGAVLKRQRAKKKNKTLLVAIKAVLRGKFIAIQAFLKKRRKISNKQFNPPPKRIRRRTNKPKVDRRKGNQRSEKKSIKQRLIK